MRNSRSTCTTVFRWTALLAGIFTSALLLYAVSHQLAPTPAAAPRPALGAPSLEELNLAIGRTEPFIEGLYKPIDQTGSSVAEYYGFPLRVYLSRDRIWRLAGEDARAFCDLARCYSATEISNVANSFSSEAFTIDFRSPETLHVPRLEVEINWDYSPTQYLVRVTNAEFDDATTDAAVYLGDVYLATYSRATVGQTTTLALEKTNLNVLQSFRYTIRHGNQVGENYYWYKQDIDRFKQLAAFEERSGFQLDFDLHAPIWGYGSAYPDDMMFDTDAATGNDAFHDCAVRSVSTPLAYPYHSKVCTAGPVAYADVSRFDPLSPTIQALHILNKYADPQHSFAGTLNHTQTPVSVAADLEGKFDDLGFGIPLCTLGRCNTALASAMRTFEFGAFEARLGFEYGRPASQAHADAVARLALDAQIGDDALVHTSDGEYYRPAQRGGFYLSWDAERRYRLDRPLPYQLIDAGLNMPPEYGGVVVSNTETAHDAYAFLVLYRCERYSVGCPTQAAKVAAPSPLG